jgi:hypothetical protein
MNISQLILCRETIAICSEIGAKRTNTLFGQNLGFFRLVRKIARSDLASSCLSVCVRPHGTTMFPLDGFS